MAAAGRDQRILSPVREFVDPKVREPINLLIWLLTARGSLCDCPARLRLESAGDGWRQSDQRIVDFIRAGIPE